MSKKKALMTDSVDAHIRRERVITFWIWVGYLIVLIGIFTFLANKGLGVFIILLGIFISYRYKKRRKIYEKKYGYIEKKK